MRKIDTTWMHPRDQITRIIDKIYWSGLTTTSGGNISIKDENGDVWVTPSAIDKGTLRASDIICVRKDGSIEGKHKPSSEFPFHAAILKCRPDIKAVIHAHPPALVLNDSPWIQIKNLSDGQVEVSWDRNLKKEDAKVLFGWNGGKTVFEMNDWTFDPIEVVIE